jgi:alpha-beta hydrolase superfamily lysophospholipase
MLHAIMFAAATASAAPAPARPPDAIYSYSILVGDAPIGSSTVRIDGSGGAAIVVTEHAAFALPKFSAATTLDYDPATLNETAYSADFELPAGPQHTDVTFKPGTLSLTVPRGTVDIPADAAAPVELVGDNLIGSSLFVPAIVQAGNLTTFTLAVLSGARALVAQVVQPAPPPARPATVPAGDVLLSIRFAGIREDYWYDPATEVVHDISIPAQHADFRLTATTALDAAPPPPAAVPTPLPTPVPHFRSREVSFASADGARLAGTLTVPDRGTGPFPAVVLVHGSGPEDRDEAIGPNAVFLQLSNALSNAGYAVLRYDKRGVAKSGGALFSGTRQHLLDDVRAAVRFARAQAEVDRTRIVLLGHSEGGELVPTVALREPAVAGVILMAPAALPLAKIMIQQAIASEPPAKRAAVIRAETAGLRTIRRSNEPQNAALRASLDLDPIVDIAKLRRPVLILQGADDAQVLIGDLPRLVTAARSANSAVTVRTFAGDNHLFEASLPGTTHDPVAALHQYLTVPARIDRRVITAILAWLPTTRARAPRRDGAR